MHGKKKEENRGLRLILIIYAVLQIMMKVFALQFHACEFSPSDRKFAVLIYFVISP